MNRLVAGHGEAATFGLAFALEELGLPYVVEPIDLHRFAQWTPQHRALSPDGNPLVLDMAERTMDHPLLALLFLAESCPGSRLLPDSPADRYAVQALIAQLDHRIGDGLSYLGWLATTPDADRADYRARLAQRPDRPVLAGWSAVWHDAVPEDERPDQARAKIGQGIETIAAVLGDREWLVGTHFTLADIVGFSLLRQAGRVGPDAAGIASLALWIERLGQRPAVHRASERIAEAGLSDTFRPPIFA